MSAFISFAIASRPLRFSFVDHGRTFLGRLVRVGERVLLLGASDAQVSLLTEVGEPPATETTPDSFAGVLEQLRMHVSSASLTPARD